MKKTALLVFIAVLLAVGVHLYQEFGGYERIPVSGGTLFGKTMGKDQDRIVLLVAGSGPTDMDGNNPLITGRNDSLRLLATGLSENGISTFRYDKRTAGRSAQTFDPNEPIDFDDFVNDCVSVIHYLESKGYREIIVAGHSQGSLVGMLAAEKTQSDGFISLCGTGYSIDVTMEKQLLQQLDEDSLEIQILRKLRSGTIDETVPADHILSPSQQLFLLSWMAHDPGILISELDIPVAILHGDADIQVDEDDYNALTSRAPNAYSNSIPGMNHVLKDVRHLGQQNPLITYGDPSFALHDDLIPAIMSYLNQIL